MRHDCMWAGHCPAEEHRLKKELPTLLSTSPTEATLLVVASQRERRTRLDTLGSIRPETPLSLSDSELEQLTSPDASDEDAKDAGSSSDDNSDDDEATPVLRRKIATSAAIPTLPPNIHPVRSHIRKVQVNNKCSSIKMASVTSMADHSYSHSDHSYHTQRRPNDNAALVDLLGIQTPSDSGEFCAPLPPYFRIAATSCWYSFDSPSPAQHRRARIPPIYQRFTSLFKMAPKPLAS